MRGYTGHEASIAIETLTILAGDLPPRALRLVTEWATLHGDELRANWQLGREHQPLQRVEPLGSSNTIKSMRSTPLLIAATPTTGYRVHVRFEDGLDADVDLSYLADYGGVFEPLRAPGYFRRLHVDPEGGTIVWPNDADIAPKTLYDHAQRQARSVA